MRYVLISRRLAGLLFFCVVVALLLWYALTGPETRPTSVAVHRLAEATPGAQSVPAVSNPEAVSVRQLSPERGSLAEYNLDRARTRSRQEEMLASIIDDPHTGAATRDEAQKRLMNQMDSENKEEELTRLLKAEGFAEPVVVLNDHGLTISLRGAVLDGPTATRVGELAARMTGVSPERIVIMERR